jgi:hypothetical protein
LGLLDRLAYEARLAAREVRDKVAADFRGSPAQANPRNRVYGYRSPNAMPDTHTATQPDNNMTGVPRPFAGGAQYATVTLNGSGNGTAVLGPQRVREHWQVNGVGVSVATAVNQAKCSIYIGTSPTANNFLGQTATGSSGDTCGAAGMDIQPGQSVFAVWTGGDAGQIATMAVFGTYSIGAPQA